MKKRGSYAVRISGIGEGDHNYSFDLDSRFFALFEHSEIREGDVHAEVVLEKKPGILSLHISLKGKVEVECDRCLEMFPEEISANQTLYVKTGEVAREEEDDVLIVGYDDHEIEISQFMYEFIMLALPYQKVHPDDNEGHSTCNPEMLKKLDAHRIKESDQDIDRKTDPRWDALKDIIEKNN